MNKIILALLCMFATVYSKGNEIHDTITVDSLVCIGYGVHKPHVIYFDDYKDYSSSNPLILHIGGLYKNNYVVYGTDWKHLVHYKGQIKFNEDYTHEYHLIDANTCSLNDSCNVYTHVKFNKYAGKLDTSWYIYHDKAWTDLDMKDLIKKDYDELLKTNKFYSNRTNTDFVDYVKSKYPYGCYDFDWKLSCVNGVEITFKYWNTAKTEKTIKYIDFWYTATNDVNDVCQITVGNNHGKCTGPVEFGDNGKWTFEPLGYTTGDASHISISKIQITYMDNTKMVLIKDKVQLL